MNATTPDPDIFLLPPETTPRVFAEDQPEYIPLPALVTPDGRVITSWELTAEELELILNGATITLVMHMFNGKCPRCSQTLGLTPVQLLVGGADLRVP